MSAGAQEMEPRALSPAPVGTSFVLVGVGTSNGAFVLDPSQPVENLDADIRFAVVGAGYTFGLFGRQARVIVVAPFAWGEVSGDVAGVRQTRDLQGLNDPRIKLSLALFGAPALTLQEFVSRPPSTVVGVSLTVTPPIGQYDAERLVNLGFNRWGLKPELGASFPMGAWTIEGGLGAWFYTTNDSYYPGHAVRTQDPIITVQANVSYTFRSRQWLALNGTWFSGGETETDGVPNSDEQNNTRVGLTFSQPLGARHSLKFTYSTGATTRRGSDFDSLNVAWQYVRTR